MKKLFVAILALSLAISANAQVGIIAGFTSSATDFKTAAADVQSKNVSLYHFGLTYKLGVGNFLAIQPSLIYNVKGAKLADVTSISTVSADFKTGFLELPVQVQVGFGLGSLARIYGIAEPFIGYAISNDIKITSTSSVKDNWDLVKSRMEYGIGLGAGVELFSHLQVSARYFWNLGDLYGATPTVSSVSSAVKSSKCNGIMISAAFLF